MGLDHRVFTLRERSCLIQYSIGNKQLSQVMHSPREDDVIHVLRRKIEPASDDASVAPALLAVPGGILLSEFRSARQGFKSFLYCLLVLTCLVRAELAQRGDKFGQMLWSVVFPLQKSLNVTGNKLPM